MPDKLLLAAHPLTPERFADLEALFAGKGCSFARGCWCMFYREVGKQALPAGMGLAGFRKERLRGLAGRDRRPASSATTPPTGPSGGSPWGRARHSRSSNGRPS